MKTHFELIFRLYSPIESIQVCLLRQMNSADFPIRLVHFPFEKINRREKKSEKWEMGGLKVEKVYSFDFEEVGPSSSFLTKFVFPNCSTQPQLISRVILHFSYQKRLAYMIDVESCPRTVIKPSEQISIF